MEITNKQNRKMFGRILLIIGILIALCSLVNASGIYVPYSKDNSYPLIIAPGETKDIQFTLSGGGTVRVTLTKGGEIATITDRNTEYDIKDTVPVNIRISIPDNVAEGTEYDVGIVARDIPPGEGGTVSIATETGASFKVLVKKPIVPTPPTLTEAPKEKSNAIWWVFGIIVIVAIILMFYLIAKAKRK